MKCETHRFLPAAFQLWTLITFVHVRVTIYWKAQANAQQLARSLPIYKYWAHQGRSAC